MNYKPIWQSIYLRMIRLPFIKQSMRILSVMTTLILMSIAVSAFSQKISVDVKRSSLKSFFKTIQDQIDVALLYSEKLVENKTITVAAKDTELTQLLADELPKHGLSFLRTDNQITIIPSSQPHSIAINTADLNIQQRTITGTVLDDLNNPIEGVTVSMKGTAIATSTDTQGQYSFSIPSESGTIVFSIIGFELLEVVVEQQTKINVTLKPQVDDLEGVVVVGYGTQRRSDLTSSVASVKGDQISSQALRSPLQALTGLAAGVEVMQNSGAPGSGLSVRVRGGNSLIGGNEPLYVIDGLPMSVSINNINPNDILSMEILKDASATAIYGSRGANGVVLITTKKGNAGRTQIEYNAYYGLQTVTKKIDMLNAQEFATLANVRAANDNRSPFFSEAEIESFGAGVNWQDEIFRTAPIQNHSLAISGGNDKTRFNISSSFFDQDGVILNSDYQQLQLRANIDHKIGDKWKVSFNNIIGRTKSNSLLSDNTERGSGVLSGALIAPPTVPIYDGNGKYSNVRQYPFSPDIAENPIAMALERKSQNTVSSLLTNLFIEGEVAPDLVLRSSLGVQYALSRGDNYSPTIFQPSATGRASISYGETLNIVNENTLTYSRTLNDDHDFTVLAGLTSEKNSFQNLSASATGFLTDILENHSLQSGTSPGVPSSSMNDYAILSGLGRLTYSYKGKYLLTSSIRADGSSRFGKENRWGYFPSASVGWRISEEDFWQTISSTINEMKVRGSWGVTGNTAVSPYQSLSILSSVQTVFDDNLFIGFAPGDSKPNPELKWETTTQIGAGLDVGFLNDKFVLSLDYYSKKTNDLLNSVPVSPSTGYTTTVKNLGSVHNRGVEVALNSQILRGVVEWDLGANFSLNRNKVISLEGGTDIFGESLGNALPAMSLVREGYPVGVFYGYVEDGLTDAGDIQYKDMDNNGAINALDRVVIGDPNPDYIIGINSAIRYKNFGLTVVVNSVQGADILNYNLSNIADGFSFGINQMRDVLENYWTADTPNPNAKYPKISQNTRYLGSDRFIENGSYIQIKNIQLSYTFLENLGVLAGTQVYLGAQNPFTFTTYTFYSPEVNTRGGGISRGIDQYGYPNARTIMFGARIKF